MTLALLTRGYVCPPSATAPGGAKVGKGPAIVSVIEVKPDIKHGRETAPRIILGVEDDD